VRRNRIWLGTDRTDQALEFALSKDIDVISMSFCLYTKGSAAIMDPLFRVVQEALRKDVVLICSTADEGNKTQKAYPAQYEATTAIACCDDGGKLIAEGSEYDAQYWVHGTGFSGTAIKYMDTKTDIRGSSVATAIAAGIASLILACHHFAAGERVYRRPMVAKMFDKMSRKHPNSKWIEPATFFRPDMFSCLPVEESEKWIREHFAVGKHPFEQTAPA
jgi:hypothetical protein